tara:strand:- start:135 stop:1190 length:1056 start_codon:yes stop_codon:yes gene_type:complete
MTQKSKPAVTIYKIANYLGISAATVSSVLANRHIERRIATKTVEKVRETARLLGYVPNMAGRRLGAHRAATRQFDLAIMTSFEAPLPLVGQLLHRLQAAVDEHTTADTRYAVSIEMFHAGELCDKPSLLDANRYHGVIITNTLPEDDRFLLQASLPYPVVILGRRIPGYYCVLEAPHFVGQQSAEILSRVGCRRLGVLHGRLLTQTTSDRMDSFKKTVKRLEGKEPVVLTCDGLDPSDAAKVLQTYFSKRKTLDGVFAVTDSLAMGAYQKLKELGKRIPEDVAVVGVGDNEVSEYFDPPLTAVAGANDAMVAEAIPLLFKLLQGEENIPKEILVVPSVLERKSTDRKTKVC